LLLTQLSLSKIVARYLSSVISKLSFNGQQFCALSHCLMVQLGARNMAGSDWTVAPNQTMLCGDVARPQYHKARLGTRSSGGTRCFAVASAARAVTADSLHRYSQMKLNRLMTRWMTLPVLAEVTVLRKQSLHSL
jgi:hypothetical protein